MAVKIIIKKKAAKSSSPPAPAPVVEEEKDPLGAAGDEGEEQPEVEDEGARLPEPVRPKITTAVKVGVFTVLPDVDLHDMMGVSKFVVHLWKEDLWYRVIGHDAEKKQLLLKTRKGVKFDAHVDRTIGTHYMVVIGPEDAEAPSAEVIAYVEKLGRGEVQAIAQPVEEEVMPAPPPKKRKVLYRSKHK